MPPTQQVQQVATSVVIPRRPITDAEQASDLFAAILASKDHILIGPGVTISYIPAGYSLVLNAMKFPADPAAKFWYPTEQAFSLTFVALNNLARMVGIKWTAVHEVACRDRYHWKRHVEATVRTFAGVEEPFIDGAELDLRDGSVAHEASLVVKTNGRGEKYDGRAAFAKKREKGAALCTSSAKARLIRQALGIRPYTAAEQGKTFVLPSLVWIPPIGNPEIDRMVAIKELGLADAIYGRRAIPATPTLAIAGPTEEVNDVDDDDMPERERVPVGQGEGLAASSTSTGNSTGGGGAGGASARDPWENDSKPEPKMRFDHLEEDVIAWVAATWDGYKPASEESWTRLEVKLRSPDLRAQMEEFIGTVLARKKT